MYMKKWVLKYILLKTVMNTSENFYKGEVLEIDVVLGLGRTYMKG